MKKGAYMKIKETLKEIFIIALILLNIVSIACIPKNLVIALQSPKAIKVNSLNRGIISQKILEEYDVKNYKLKGSCTVLGLIATPIILLYAVFLYTPEHILEKDNNKYIAKVHSFKRVNVYYHDYINFFLVGNKVRIHENYGSGGYDPFDGRHDNYTPQTYCYYDKDGNIIKTNNIRYYKTSDSYNTNQSNKTELLQESDILYEKVINNNTIIRVINKESILAQRSIISIEKTTNGGQNWEKQLSEGMQIHNGAKFIFLDENIGFINDPGIAGTDGENRGLLVTTNGGKTFTSANILHPENIEEKNLFVSDVPYLENNILKVKIYTINHTKNPAKTFYEFYSKDNGITWIYLKVEE